MGISTRKKHALEWSALMILALRQQLVMLKSSVKRPRDAIFGEKVQRRINSLGIKEVVIAPYCNRSRWTSGITASFKEPIPLTPIQEFG